MEALDISNQSMSSSDGARRAALYMHGVSEQDRRWLLGRLGESELSVLTPLLDELRDLGIPKNGFSISKKSLPTGQVAVARTEVATAVQEHEPNHLNRALVMSDASEDERLKFLNETSIHSLCAVLEHEPIEVLVCILNLHSWQWRMGFLAEFETSRRFQLRDRIEKSVADQVKVLPVKFKETLLKSLVDRIQEFESNTLLSERVDLEVDSRSSFVQRLYSLFGR